MLTIIFGFITISLMLYFLYWLETNKGKGRFSEVITYLYLKHKLDLSESIIMEDILFPDGKGGSTQIDHLIISPKGIFVLELKCYFAHISGHKKRWDKLEYSDYKKELWYARYGKNTTYEFQNPFHQNYKHIQSISNETKLNHKLFKNVAIIVNSKNKEKNNSINNLFFDLESFIDFYENANDDVITNVQEVSDLIWEHKIPNTKENRRKHIEYVKSIVEKKKKTS